MIFLRQNLKFILILLWLSACAQTSKNQFHTPFSAPKTTTENTSYRNTPVVVSPQKTIQIKGQEIKISDFDIPIVSNSHVEKWIDYFTGKGRPHFEKFLMRSEYFIPYITPLLAENNLPQDLVYVAMIESGFSNFAKSKAKAVGPWQFIRPTANRYGLQVDYWVDERRNVEKSTLAAVLYFKDLFGHFESWELAAASYNAGESRIAGAIRRYGTKDFWALVKHNYLAPETRNYVPKWFAAAILSKHRKAFGFEEKYLTPQDLEKEDFLSELPELEVFTPEEAEAEGLNSELAATEEDEENTEVLDSGEVPAATGNIQWERAPARLSLFGKEEWTAEMAQSESVNTPGELFLGGGLAKISQTPHTDKKGQVSQSEVVEFEVESPADLKKIALASGASFDYIKKLNPDLLQWCTPPGEDSRKIKLPLQSKERFLKTYNNPDFPREVHFMTYKVKKNESLKSISRRFRIDSIEPILELNKMRKGQSIRYGQTILLPLPSEKKTTLSKR